MKRKVVKQGPSTLMISLPVAWTKKNKIHKGDELNILEQGSKVIISTEKVTEKNIKTISLELHQVNEKMVNRVIAACYKAGYNEIIIEYESHKDLDIIQKTVERTYMGYDLDYQSGDKVKISSLSELDQEQFTNIERKLFLSFKNLISELLQLLSTEDYEELDKLILMDKQIDMYADFCRRLINQGMESPENIHCMYCIYEQIEISADAFKDYIKDIKRTKKVDQIDLEILPDVIELFNSLYELYYSFNFKELNKFQTHYDKINKSLLGASLANAKSKSYIILHFIARTLFELKSAILTLRLK